MWPATAFSVARGSIQENHQIRTILPLITVNVSGEGNVSQDLLGMALRYARPSQGGPRAKLIAHRWFLVFLLFQIEGLGVLFRVAKPTKAPPCRRDCYKMRAVVLVDFKCAPACLR